MKYFQCTDINKISLKWKTHEQVKVIPCFIYSAGRLLPWSYISIVLILNVCLNTH